MSKWPPSGHWNSRQISKISPASPGGRLSLHKDISATLSSARSTFGRSSVTCNWQRDLQRTNVTCEYTSVCKLWLMPMSNYFIVRQRKCTLFRNRFRRTIIKPFVLLSINIIWLMKICESKWPIYSAKVCIIRFLANLAMVMIKWARNFRSAQTKCLPVLWIIAIRRKLSFLIHV